MNQLRSHVTDLEFSISYTTRQPRGSEQAGSEYHFTTREEFERMQRDGEFLESAEVFGNLYGTACHSLTDAAIRGKDLLLDIDVQGAAQVREKMPEAVSIFVLPPNPETLATRLRNRSRAEGSISEGVIEGRLAKATHEIGNYGQYGYILVNDVLDHAVEELEAIVYAERARSGQTKPGPDGAHLLQLANSCRQENAQERLRPVLASFGLQNLSLDRAATHV